MYFFKFMNFKGIEKNTLAYFIITRYLEFQYVRISFGMLWYPAWPWLQCPCIFLISLVISGYEAVKCELARYPEFLCIWTTPDRACSAIIIYIIYSPSGPECSFSLSCSGYLQYCYIRPGPRCSVPLYLSHVAGYL